MLGIGVVHQECLAFDNLSVAENLFVNCQPARRGLVNWAAMRAQATAVLRDLDADFDADLPAGRLSIAQKYVMQIARALAHESRVLIFDEPTASLSQRECVELFRIVHKLRDAGCALRSEPSCSMSRRGPHLRLRPGQVRAHVHAERARYTMHLEHTRVLLPPSALRERRRP